MLPWLPFLTFPDSRRKRRFRVTIPQDGSILCSVEVLEQIPKKDIEIHLAPTRQSNRSIPSPVPSTSSSKSPRSGSGLPSRPNSAHDKKPLFAPPPELKPSRNQRKGLETSSAMLELFGSPQPSIQITSPKQDVFKENVNTEPKEIIAPAAVLKSDENKKQEIQEVEADVFKSTGMSACFETIQHPDMSQKHFGRKNVLERESLQQSEWEPMRTQPSTSSTFQVRVNSSLEQLNLLGDNTDWLAWLLSFCFALCLLDIALRAGFHGRRILDNRRP